MRKNGDILEYVVVYVDDLEIAMKKPQEYLNMFKTNGTRPISVVMMTTHFVSHQ
jgi:hypothetical protein